LRHILRHILRHSLDTPVPLREMELDG